MSTKLLHRVASATFLVLGMAVLALVVLVMSVKKPIRTTASAPATINWDLSYTRMVRAIGFAGAKDMESIQGKWQCRIALPSGRFIDEDAVLIVADSEYGQLHSLSIQSRDYTPDEIMEASGRVKQWGLLVSEVQPRLDKWYDSVQRRRGSPHPLWRLGSADLGDVRLSVYVLPNVGLVDGYRLEYTLSWDK